MRALRQFSLRDGLWLTVVVALLAAWLLEKRASQERERQHLKTIEMLEVERLAAAANARMASRMADLLDEERLRAESLSKRRDAD